MKKTFTTKMTKLTEMARDGEPRPTTRSSAGKALASCTSKEGQKKFPEFNEEIRKLAPHWFEGSVAMAKLLDLAKNNRPRPLLANLLRKYTKNRSFNEQIRSIAPDWFKKK